jgi:LDH2 family malate/lactate/ureidoglycolate dehydrogenase
MRFPVARLEGFVTAVFEAVGALPKHAAIVATRLVEGDLRGRTGHGLMRVRQYVERARAGGINLDPNIQVVHESPVSGVVDGDNGFGPVVVTRATETAIAKAEASGIGWVGARNSNHAGAAGVYPAMALRRGLGAIYMAVAAGNVMPPWGGIERLLGTNPIAVAIPAGESPAFQLDMATTVTSHGTIRVMETAGRPLPEGWVVDAAGHPITDPARADEGFLLPIGGHKGSGLNIMIGLLAGVMNGAAFGHDVVGRIGPLSTPTNTGQTIVVFRPDLFMTAVEFAASMDRHLGELRASAPARGSDPVRLPGERAVELEEEQRRLGIPVPAQLLEDLRRLADELGVADPLS